MVGSGSLFAEVPSNAESEQIVALFSAPGVKIERIVSTGQATPASEWLDQDWTEWVALCSGSAGVRFEGEATPRTLEPGDYLLIPAHTRHRVEWTDLTQPTIWLAALVDVR